jgi:hypothetical protein
MKGHNKSHTQKPKNKINMAHLKKTMKITQNGKAAIGNTPARQNKHKLMQPFQIKEKKPRITAAAATHVRCDKQQRPRLPSRVE